VNNREREQLDALVTRTIEILGAAVVGAYLHGSAAFDSLQPRSDLDVLVVTERRLSPIEKQSLTVVMLELTVLCSPRRATMAIPAEPRLPVRRLAAGRVRCG